MKKIISGLLLVTLVFASILAMIPASAEGTSYKDDGEYNVMGGSDAKAQWTGYGNVFYYDYHKYIANGGQFNYDDTANGISNSMPEGARGADAYTLRLGNNNGSGTASVCDGDLYTIGFTHTSNSQKKVTIGGITYDHGFGYSFRKSVVVDGVKFYIPTTQKNGDANSITQIDVYGAVKTSTAYGMEAEKVLLASFSESSIINAPKKANDTVTVKVLEGAFDMAMKVDYIFFLVNLGQASYSFTEIELNGCSLATNEVRDFSDLRQLYKDCEALDRTKYTTESWSNLQTVLESTYAVNKNASSSQSDIDDAVYNLYTAKTSLALKPADKAALDEAIGKTTDLKKESYTPASWTAFENALAKANEVKAKADATQEEADTAAANLKAAITALIKPGDKTELNATITSAKTLKQSDYSNSLAWQSFQKALSDAETVAADTDAVQDEINGALATLKERITALSASANTPSTDTDNKNETPDNKTETDDSKSEADEETPADNTEDVVVDESTTVPDESDTTGEIAPAPVKKRCGAAVGTTAITLSIVTALGTALVVKKKD